MIPLKPKYSNEGISYHEDRFYFYGIAIFECIEEYYHSIPIGHFRQFPLEVKMDGTASVENERAHQWLSGPIVSSLKKNDQAFVTINIDGKATKKKVVVLNCIDPTYGHAIYKLFNAQAYKNEDISVIVIVHDSLKWLVPDYVDEIWTLKTPLKNLEKSLKGFDAFIKQQLERFPTVYLSEAFAQPNIQNIDYEDFTRTKIFDLTNFNSLPPTVTFIHREDRFFIGNRFWELIYLASVKLKVFEFFKPVLSKAQIGFYKRIISKIKSAIPNAEINLVGLGSGKVRLTHANVDISESPSAEVEKDWLQIYAKSHVVIGVHGSNMMLPTLLSAGFINLLPTYKVDHVGEDILSTHNNRELLFLARHLNIPSSSKIVADHAISMIQNFGLFKTFLEEGP